jgi:putative flippase GtrA
MLSSLRRTSLYAWLTRFPALHQFVRYGLVGVLNVAVYFALYNLLRLVDTHPNLAAAVAFFVTSLQSFALNKLWAFRDARRHAVFRQYLVFVMFTMIGLAINQAAFTVFLLPLRRFGALGENAALLGAIPFSVAWNFFSYRRWTFVAVPASDGTGRSPLASGR